MNPSCLVLKEVFFSSTLLSLSSTVTHTISNTALLSDKTSTPKTAIHLPHHRKTCQTFLHHQHPSCNTAPDATPENSPPNEWSATNVSFLCLSKPLLWIKKSHIHSIIRATWISTRAVGQSGMIGNGKVDKASWREMSRASGIWNRWATYQDRVSRKLSVCLKLEHRVLTNVSLEKVKSFESNKKLTLRSTCESPNPHCVYSDQPASPSSWGTIF
jgi:hypothetical protein